MKQAIIRTAEQEEVLLPGHKLFFVRNVVNAATNSLLSLQRGRIEPGGEICLHSHSQGETVYILSGAVTCTLGSENSELGAGSCVVVPPDVPRGFKNTGDQPVELLALFTPALC
jgi:quercetin dioxygenase-like cupin family protein